MVEVANPDGVTEDGIAYFICYIDGEILEPDETTELIRVEFDNPTRGRFSYSTSVWGSVPDSVANIGPDGGVIETSTGYFLSIPSGALEQETIISLDILSEEELQFERDQIQIREVDNEIVDTTKVDMTWFLLTYISPIPANTNPYR